MHCWYQIARCNRSSYRKLVLAIRSVFCPPCPLVFFTISIIATDTGRGPARPGLRLRKDLSNAANLVRYAIEDLDCSVEVPPCDRNILGGELLAVPTFTVSFEIHSHRHRPRWGQWRWHDWKVDQHPLHYPVGIDVEYRDHRFLRETVGGVQNHEKRMTSARSGNVQLETEVVISLMQGDQERRLTRRVEESDLHRILWLAIDPCGPSNLRGVPTPTLNLTLNSIVNSHSSYSAL